MADRISDDEVGRRLRAASDALGVEAGETVAGDTAIAVARDTLLMLSDRLEAISLGDVLPRLPDLDV